MSIKDKRQELFDENFNCKTLDRKEIINFCNEIRLKTGVQTCNGLGLMYEYLPQAYSSVVKKYEL